MNTFKFITQILLAVALALGLSACSKKKSKSSMGARAVRHYDQNNPTLPSGGFTSQWGAITNFSPNNLLEFLNVDPGSIGQVSPVANAPTGIRFFGNINDYTQQGTIEIRVYDDIALQSGQFIRLVFDDCESRVNGVSVTATCYDDISYIELRGTVELPGFSGQIGYGFGQEPPTYLGQFSIAACGFLICD